MVAAVIDLDVADAAAVALTVIDDVAGPLTSRGWRSFL